MLEIDTIQKWVTVRDWSILVLCPCKCGAAISNETKALPFSMDLPVFPICARRDDKTRPWKKECVFCHGAIPSKEGSKVRCGAVDIVMERNVGVMVVWDDPVRVG